MIRIILEELEDDIGEMPSQERASGDTAINFKYGRIPDGFKKVGKYYGFPNGGIILDYGGGRQESEDLANAWLAKEGYDCVDIVWDYTHKNDEQILADIQKHGGADVGVCFNVLNVIKEPEVRLYVLKRLKKYCKRGAPIYIDVHAGDKKDQEKGARATGGDKWQEFRPLTTYLDEVKSVFPNAKQEHGLIVATNS